MSSELTSKELQINFKMREVSENRVYEFGEYRLDAGHLLLFRGSERVNLTPKVVETLLVLIERSGEVVSKDELMNALWPETTVEESNLSQNLYVLRKALGTNNDGKPFVETLRRRGYRFCGEVSYTHPGFKNTNNTKQVKIERMDNIYSVVDWNRGKIDPSPPARRPWVPALFLFASVAVISLAAFAVYRSSATGNEGKNAVVQFDTRIMERLTTSGRTVHGAISPDGRYLAHSTEDADGGKLWVRQVLSSVDVPLGGPTKSEIVWIGFGTDSDSVYYTVIDRDKGESEVYRIPILGGPPVLVVRNGSPIGFSPDGRSIAYSRIDQAESRLLLANADGTNERVLASKNHPESFLPIWNAPAWSPDGKTVACPARLDDGAGSYETLVLVNIDDGTSRALTATRWENVGQPKWDKDGVFLTAADKIAAPNQIWHISVPDGTATQVTSDLNGYSDLSLTADGTRLAAIRNQTLTSINVEKAGEQKEIATEVGWLENAEWTADGRIVYISSAGGEIWIINADGSNPKQLTSGAVATRGLAVSPDGGSIIFSSRRSGRSNLWKVRIDGSEPVQITNGAGETYPRFSGDGKWIVFQTGETDPYLAKVSSAGGEIVRLSEKRGLRPSVSPDGSLVAYRYLDAGFAQSRWSIGVMSIDGGPQKMRFDLPSTVVERFVAFAPDGRSVAFLDTHNGASDIWLQPLTGQGPKRLTNLNFPNLVEFAWSRDGRSLVTVASKVTRDMIMMKR